RRRCRRVGRVGGGAPAGGRIGPRHQRPPGKGRGRLRPPRLTEPAPISVALATDMGAGSEMWVQVQSALRALMNRSRTCSGSVSDSTLAVLAPAAGTSVS